MTLAEPFVISVSVPPVSAPSCFLHPLADTLPKSMHSQNLLTPSFHLRVCFLGPQPERCSMKIGHR